MTEKLYYLDSECYEFQARIIDRVHLGKKLALVLDKTCFYPEGGGQPSDQGKINGIPVYDVQKDEDKILHFVERDTDKDVVEGHIDKDRRVDYVQQHTGQHILSQALLRAGNIKTVSVHFGEQETYIETDAAAIPEELLSTVEDIANDIINRDLKVQIKWVDASELHKHPTRRPPPEVDTVRIVQIGDFDATACGGLHVTTTGQIGLCKISGSEKIRGRTRIHTKIGNRAYRDYREKTRLLRDLGLFLTCGEDVILKRVEDLNASYGEAKKEINRYLSEWIPLLFKERLENAPRIGKITYIEQVFDQVDQKAMKIFLERALSAPERIVMLLNRQEDQLSWMAGHSVSREFDVMELIREYLPLMDARGGGKGQLVQGGGRNINGIADFLANVRHKLERNMKNHE